MITVKKKLVLETVVSFNSFNQTLYRRKGTSLQAPGHGVDDERTEREARVKLGQN